MFPEPERLTSEILGCTQRSVTAKEALKPLAHDPRPVARDSSTATEVSGCGGRELGDDVVSLPHVTCKFAHTVVSRDKVKYIVYNVLASQDLSAMLQGSRSPRCRASFLLVGCLLMLRMRPS